MRIALDKCVRTWDTPMETSRRFGLNGVPSVGRHGPPTGAIQISILALLSRHCFPPRVAHMRSRRKADAMAKELLESPAGITDAVVTLLLDRWLFKANLARKNITPDGAPPVHSDTIGLVMSRTGKVFVTKSARQFPNFLSVLCRWLREHGRPEFSRPFCFTSVCLNHGFAPALHRDANNYGTSITKAFGKFEGGVLKYWPGSIFLIGSSGRWGH